MLFPINLTELEITVTRFHSAHPRLHNDIAACLASVLMLGILSTQALAQSASPGANTATGSITVNGNKTEFKHAYTSVTKSTADNKSETILMMTDKPLSAKAASDEWARSSEARSNKVQMMEITFGGDKKIIRANFTVDPLKGGANTADYKAEISRLTASAFSGRVHSGGEQKEFKNTFSFDVRFDTAMLTPRTPNAIGKAAWATPQGKVIAEFLRAARAGDKAALKRVMLADQVKALDGPDAARFLEFVKMSPNPKTAEFDSLFVDGDSAEAKIAERSKDGATSSDYKLRLINGVWFVAM